MERESRFPGRFPCVVALALSAVVSGLSPALHSTSHAQSLDLLQGFEGVYSGWVPADPIIAAGPGSLVTMVSGRIAIFSKQGSKLFEQNLGAGGFWAAQGGDQVAEPWVIFDPNSGRFIASAAEFGNGKGRLYLAVSKTDNPLTSSDWHKYPLERSGTHQGPGFPGVPTYPDYAKVGVDGDAIYVTAGHFAKDQSITASFSHAEIFAIDKAPLLSGGSLQVVYQEPVITESYSEAAPFSIHPAVVHDSGSAMYFVQSHPRRADDRIVVRTWSDALSGSPATSVDVVGVAPFDRPPNVPQLGSSTLLENIDARLMSAVVRGGSLWTSHAILDPAVDGESVVRWYEFDLASQPGTVLLAQSGNVDPGPGIHTWLPSINVDADGNMGLCFSVGRADEYAAIGYTGRLATDPLDTPLTVRIARTGNGAYTKGGWGEYSGLAMDPNGYTFWLFHQYPVKAKGGGAWRTYVGAFEVAPPIPPADPLHCGDLDGLGANSGKYWKATVAVTIHDGNESPVQGASVSAHWGTDPPTSGVTDATGRITFTLNSISKQISAVTLTIDEVTYPGLNYSALDNHDLDGDSNGTTITVSKPGVSAELTSGKAP